MRLAPPLGPYAVRRLVAVALWLAAWPAAHAHSVWLIGESHDQPAHQQAAADTVRRLAEGRRLQALVLEMADAGRSTAGLARDASEDDVRRALDWKDQAWPWARYGPLVMAAVRAGVPVQGGNRTRASLREAMQDPQWDAAVPPAARAHLADAVRGGHCGLLPESQVPAMVRMQVARDRSLAEAVLKAADKAGPDAVVVLHAGAQHASRLAGVPLHLQALAPQLQLRSIGFVARKQAITEGEHAGFDELQTVDVVPEPDHCAELKKRGMPPVAASVGASAS